MASGGRTGLVGDFPDICSCGKLRATASFCCPSHFQALGSTPALFLHITSYAAAPCPTLTLPPAPRQNNLLFCGCHCLTVAGSQGPHRARLSTLSSGNCAACMQQFSFGVHSNWQKSFLSGNNFQCLKLIPWKAQRMRLNTAQQEKRWPDHSLSKSHAACTKVHVQCTFSSY